MHEFGPPVRVTAPSHRLWQNVFNQHAADFVGHEARRLFPQFDKEAEALLVGRALLSRPAAVDEVGQLLRLRAPLLLGFVVARARRRTAKVQILHAAADTEADRLPVHEVVQVLVVVLRQGPPIRVVQRLVARARQQQHAADHLSCLFVQHRKQRAIVRQTLEKQPKKTQPLRWRPQLLHPLHVHAVKRLQMAVVKRDVEPVVLIYFASMVAVAARGKCQHLLLVVRQWEDEGKVLQTRVPLRMAHLLLLQPQLHVTELELVLEASRGSDGELKRFLAIRTNVHVVDEWQRHARLLQAEATPDDERHECINASGLIDSGVVAAGVAVRPQQHVAECRSMKDGALRERQLVPLRLHAWFVSDKS